MAYNVMSYKKKKNLQIQKYPDTSGRGLSRCTLGVTNKEYYGMLWYFLIVVVNRPYSLYDPIPDIFARS